MAYRRPGSRGKPHAADIHAAAEIAAAVGFAVHFRKGPQETYTEQSATLAGARGIEATMNATHGQNGRRAVVYAITATGAQYPVPSVRAR